MKRPLVTLGLLGLLAFPVATACNQAVTPEDESDGNNTSGSSNSSAGSGGLVAPMAGTGPGATAGSGNNVVPVAGAGTGGSAPATAGASAGGSEPVGGIGGAGGAPLGGAAGAGIGGGSVGGGPNPACPVKIDSAVMCTQVISCPNAYCGVFQMGSKNCDCAMATGPYDCSPCDYPGRTEPIVQPPAAVLPACAADDMTLEKSTPTCTKGDRCKSLTVDKNRFCACWEAPSDGALKWDCDTQPMSWPQ